MDEMGWGEGLLSPFLIFPLPLPPSLFPLVPAEKAGSEKAFFCEQVFMSKVFWRIPSLCRSWPPSPWHSFFGGLSLEIFPSKRRWSTTSAPPPLFFSAALLIPDGRRREEREDRATDFEFEFIAVFSPPLPPLSRRRRRDVEERGTFFEWGKSKRGLFASKLQVSLPQVFSR